jgi:hypothetical protein
MRALLDVLGVSIGDHELLEILRPWLRSAASWKGSDDEARNGFRAQTQRLGTFRNALENSRNGFRAQTQRFANSAPQPPDLPIRPNLINKRSPHANSDALATSSRATDDAAHAQEAAERAERFRIARAMLEDVERAAAEEIAAERSARSTPSTPIDSFACEGASLEPKRSV